MLHLRSRASLGLLVLTLAALPGIPARAEGASAPTVDVRQLLAIARGGLTAAAQAATGPLSPGQAAGSALWAAIDGMGQALNAAGTAFATRSPTFFDSLSAGSRALAELKAVWSHAGVSNPGVLAGLQSLSSSYQLLRGSYGWEALRQQQGGPLTPDEQRRFQAMQAAQAALAQRLASLRQQAARSGDAQAAADLGRLLAQAQGMAQAQVSLAAYLAAQLATENLQGEFAGDSRSLRPATKKAWKKAAPLVEDLTTGGDIGFVFTSDLSKVDGWAPLDAPVEVPAGVDLGTGEATVSAAPGGAGNPAGIADPVDGIPGDRGLEPDDIVDLGNLGDVDSIDSGTGSLFPSPAPAVVAAPAPTPARLSPASAASVPPVSPMSPVSPVPPVSPLPSVEDLRATFALLGHLLG